MSAAIYSNFFTPHTISLLLCLYELQKKAEANEVDLRSTLVQYLLQKIIDISDYTKHCHTNQEFEAEMMAVTGDQAFLEKYQEIVGEIGNFNKFYGDVSNMLKNLRSIRSSKLEQSNIIDFFVRRLYIYFEKLDFKEIVAIYARFEKYVRNEGQQIRQHEFMLTKSIEEVKFNLENYSILANPEDFIAKIDALSNEDHTFKTSYLKGLASAQVGKPMESAHYLRRYFDKNLGNLFHDRLVDGVSGNKINHCILSSAYAGLQLGNFDQCLQSISEGLRISQNNSDEESINNCIIYLYSIAEKLGKFREQILLAEHAITHSLNQSNLVLTLYSCLSCSTFEKKYDCGDSSLSLLKTREVSWKDALHFSKKKIHSQFENNCRNIYHTYRNLLIPSFVHKLAVLNHLPELQALLINPFYQRPQLMELSIYKEFKGENRFEQKLRQAEAYLRMGCKLLLGETVAEMEAEFSENCSPHQRICIDRLKVRIILSEGSLQTCYDSAEKLLSYARRNGFTKRESVDGLLLISEIFLRNELFYDALIKIEEALKICRKHELNEERIKCEILKADLYLQLPEEPTAKTKSFSILQQIEEQGELTRINSQTLKLFLKAKLKLTKETLLSVGDSSVQQMLEKGIVEHYERIVEILVKECELVECGQWLGEMLRFVERHPVYMKKGEALKRGLKVCEKSLAVLRGTEVKADAKVFKKVMEKVRRAIV